MGKITSYNMTEEFQHGDVILVDGSSYGTRQMKTADLYSAIPDDVTSVPIKRSVWQERYLGTSITSDQYAQIRTGLFKGLTLGAYWDIGDHQWQIVDFDYWYGCNGCTTHHLVIMPKIPLYDSVWNSSGAISIAYNPSYIHNKGLSSATTIITNVFGSSHILKKKESLTATVDANNDINSLIMANTTVEIPDEIMIFGSSNLKINYAYNTHGTLMRQNETSFGQFAGMAIGGRDVISSDYSYWLRDGVSYSSYIAIVTQNGGESRITSEKTTGVRPVFGLIG